jgi:hypothetical protein
MDPGALRRALQFGGTSRFIDRSGQGRFGLVSNIAFPAQLGELAFMLWLVIKGAKPQPLGAAVSSLAAG